MLLVEKSRENEHILVDKKDILKKTEFYLEN